MENSFSDVNWLLTGLVGVATSVIGAFFYAFLGKLTATFSIKKRSKRLEKLRSEIKKLEDLNSSDSKVIIYCFRNLFYVLTISALASTVSYFSFIDKFTGALSSVSLWVAVFIVGFNVFITLGKLSQFEEQRKELLEEISRLERIRE